MRKSFRVKFLPVWTLSPDETISSFVWHKVSTTTAIQEEIHCLDPQITTGTSPGIQIFPDYRLPISWLVFLLELLIGHVRRKAQIATQHSATLISHRLGEECRELWVELLEKFAAYWARVVAVYTLPLTPIGTLHLQTSSKERGDSPACVWGALGRRKASPVWAVPGSEVHASA